MYVLCIKVWIVIPIGGAIIISEYEEKRSIFVNALLYIDGF